MTWQVIEQEKDKRGKVNYIEISNGAEIVTVNSRYDKNECYGKLEFFEVFGGVAAEFEIYNCAGFEDAKAKLVQAARDKIAELNKVLESLEKFSLDG